MIKWAAVVVALLLCWDHCQADLPGRNPEAAFSAACRLSEYPCDGLAPPEIRHEGLKSWGMLGKYRLGDRHITMEKSLVRTNARYWSVVIHEMVHYIQHWSLEPFTGTPCDRERESWDAANAWLQEINRGDLIDLKWYEMYEGCSRPF